MKTNNIYLGDALTSLKTFPDNWIQCVVTSPPYWGLRDYGIEGQFGLESDMKDFLSKFVEMFTEVKRVLKNDGTLWLNMGDSYYSSKTNSTGGLNEFSNTRYAVSGAWFESRKLKANLKAKDMAGIPWRCALALQEDGWYLRSDIIWHKPNPMPESVTDRPTKAHEYLFLLSKSKKYLYNSCRDVGFPNMRTVWTIPTQGLSQAHFATFPEKLVEPCIKAGSNINDIILDPFMGAGTVALVALKLGRRFVGIELNPEYIKIANDRIKPYFGINVTDNEKIMGKNKLTLQNSLF